MPSSGMPKRDEERHHTSDDQFYCYSDDDSGSLNDAYFLTPTSPPPDSKPNGRSRRQTEPTYQTRLQPLSEGEDGHAIAEDEGLSSNQHGLASHVQSTYGTIVSELSQQAPQVPDKKLARRLRRKQLEHIAREKAVYEVRGKEQDQKCRDVGWAVLFVVQLLLIVFSALRFGSGVVLSHSKTKTMDKSMGVLEITDSSKGVDSVAFTNVDDVLEQLQEFDMTEYASEKRLTTSLFTIDYQNVIKICWITGFYACILSVLTVCFMLIIAKSLIQTTLVFSIVMSLAWGWIGLLVPGAHYTIPIMGFIALFLTVGYTFLKWDRIPFAATNLNTALAAMRCTADISLVGIGMLMVAFAWNVIWSTAFIGIVDTINTRDCGSIDDDDTICTQEATSSHISLYVVLLISFLWTNMVIKNIVQVTVASTVGTWWFHPNEITPCCTRAVTSPLVRSFTTSFGSICLGSLLVIPCQFLRRLSSICCIPCERYLCRPESKRRDNRWLCRFLESVFHFNRCCNRWSYAYIGMYQYGFVDAGEKALQLFETREWTEVVSDNLIHNVLMIGSIVMGGSTGTFGVLVEEMDGYTFSSFHKPIITAFIIGSVLGFVLSSILLVGVIGSAFDTVLVCFAAGPFEFHQNHPYLSQEMRESWSQQVWEDSPV